MRAGSHQFIVHGPYRAPGAAIGGEATGAGLALVFPSVSWSSRRAAARYHGDLAAAPGMLDFAVNIRADAPPRWLADRLSRRLSDLAHYPSVDEDLV
ncbi:MAG: hypothetical protein JOZ49_02275, partial [Mycolicibacterium sp.]|nr:hypothetical protein [Mycolicibacterium sp.]